MAEHRYDLKSILANHVDAPYDSEKREFIERVASALYERHKSFSQWPESVQLFYAGYDINYQVGNGGFAQAAYNVPELLAFAQKLFQTNGRRKAARLCEKAIAMLPRELQEHLEKGLRDRPSIDHIFAHFNESEMSTLDEAVPDEFWADDLLQNHVQKNRKGFESIP